MFTPVDHTGGSCDCGDLQAWRAAGCCALHATPPTPSAALPAELLESGAQTLGVVLEAWLELLQLATGPHKTVLAALEQWFVQLITRLFLS